MDDALDHPVRQRRVILAELILFCSVFAATAWLTTWQSPREVAPPEQKANVVGPIAVIDPWAPAMPSGLGTGAGYMVIINNQAADDRLVAASSPWAEHVTLHASSTTGTMAHMRALQTLTVPAGGQVALTQGAYHLMFTGLYAPFAAGDVVPVTLVFERAGKIDVLLKVRPLVD